MFDMDIMLGTKKSKKSESFGLDMLKGSSKKINNDALSSLFGVKPVKSSNALSDLMIKPSHSSKPDLLMTTTKSTKKSNIIDIMSPKKSSSSGMDYLLGNTSKNKKSKASVRDASYIINGKPSRTKMKMGSIIGDKVTKSQRSLFNQAKSKRKPMMLFADFDKDGVINGLDCAPYNPIKHGFFGSLASSAKHKYEDVKENIKEKVDTAGEAAKEKLGLKSEAERYEDEVDSLGQEQAEAEWDVETYEEQAKKLREAGKEGLAKHYEDKAQEARNRSEELIGPIGKAEHEQYKAEVGEKDTSQEIIDAAKKVKGAIGEGFKNFGSGVAVAGKFLSERNEKVSAANKEKQKAMIDFYEKNPKLYPGHDTLFGNNSGMLGFVQSRAGNVSSYLAPSGQGYRSPFESSGQGSGMSGQGYGMSSQSRPEGDEANYQQLVQNAMYDLSPGQLGTANSETFEGRPNLRANYILKTAMQNRVERAKREAVEAAKWEIEKRQFMNRINMGPLEQAQMGQQYKYAQYQQKLSDVNTLKLDEELNNLYDARKARQAKQVKEAPPRKVQQSRPQVYGVREFTSSPGKTEYVGLPQYNPEYKQTYNLVKEASDVKEKNENK